MSAFRPISPQAAVQILDAADVGINADARLLDLAVAGIVKGYARLIETDTPGKPHQEVRDSRIGRDLWRRIVHDNKTPDVYSAGSVHLEAVGDAAAMGRTSVIGIRFDAKSVHAAATDHGSIAPLPPLVKATCSDTRPAPTPPIAAPTENAQAPLPPVTRPPLIEEGAVSISIEDAAAAIGVSRGTIYNWIAQGRLIAPKIGNRRLVSVDSIRALLKGTDFQTAGDG